MRVPMAISQGPGGSASIYAELARPRDPKPQKKGILSDVRLQ